jgi:predicted Rossmann-fold nucleotide-binding protein
VSQANLPYQPFHGKLYAARELFAGFDPARPASYAETMDFETYRHFVRTGRGTDAPFFESMMQSLHDNSVAKALRAFLRGRRCVAIMGGHKLERGSEAYRRVAVLSRTLARAGLTLASGGGPGAMEATHLGAALSAQPAGALDAAIGELAQARVLPPAGDMVDSRGRVDAKVVAALHGWFRPAHAIAGRIRRPGFSVAVPTWHYGHEPSSPLASHIAKYFQNSVREDGLLAIATYGVIYSEGKAGTLQEIFQDAAQNYYRTCRWFSPMVLLGRKYWTRTFPVAPVLDKLFKEDHEQHRLLVTDDIDEAVRHIRRFKPPSSVARILRAERGRPPRKAR